MSNKQFLDLEGLKTYNSKVKEYIHIEDSKVRDLVKGITVEKIYDSSTDSSEDSSVGLIYHLKSEDTVLGTINIPRDLFVKSVSFNEETSDLQFTFQTLEGESVVNVNISLLIDVYDAGNGLYKDDHTIGVLIDPETEDFISVSEQGVKINNVLKALNKTTNTRVIYEHEFDTYKRNKRDIYLVLDNSYVIVNSPNSTTTIYINGEPNTIQSGEPFLFSGSLNSTYRMFLDSDASSIDFSNFDTSNIEDMRSMFSEASNITSLDLSNFDISNVERIAMMFYGCSKLENIQGLENFDTSKISSMQSLFYKCPLRNISINNWNTSNVTDMSHIFSNCESLETVDVSRWDTSNITDTYNTFYDVHSLTSLDLSGWTTDKVTRLRGLFCRCSSLVEVALGNWNLINSTDNRDVFYNCTALTTITGNITNLKESITLQDSPLLTRESALVFINGVYDFVGNNDETRKTLTFHADTRALLSDNDIAIASSKGWTIA